MTAAEFIAKEEGFRENPYRDSAGYWTIGWGRLLSDDRDADPAQWGQVTKEDEMRDHFAPGVERRRRAVLTMFDYSLWSGGDRVAALTSFAYNLGLHALETSKLRRIINEPYSNGWAVRVALEWVDWSNETIGGVKQASAGLLDRRRREAALFFGLDGV